jgi:tetratricopeptide (TPR) repeat protein
MTSTRPLATSAVWVTAVVGAAVFAVAYDDGGYAATSRSTVAVAVWWMILVGVAVGVWPLGRISRGAVVPGALLAAFACWDLASTAWSSSAEDAFAEFDRTALYLGIYTLAVLAADRRRLVRWVDGLALAIAAIALVALVSRLFPGSFSSRGLPTFLPNTAARLSFPLDYWNGLGIFVGIAFPLLLGSVLAADRLRRALALGVLPALGAVVYLTSSRGAVAALAGGVVVFVLAQPRRWAALGATLAGTVGTAASIGVLLGTERWPAAVFIALICVATVVVFEIASTFVPKPEVSRRLGAAAVIAIAGAVGAAGFATHPFREFTRLPPAQGDAVGAHLLSGSGSGRWQFWQAALDEFRSAPLHGGGAGSYEAWWDQNGSFSYAVRDAHSLYLETLGELGIVGFLLLIGSFAAAIAVGAQRLLRARGTDRTLIAALLGAATVYLIGAGIDWMWELTAVSLVGITTLGLIVGPATPDGPRPQRRLPRVAIAAAAGAVMAAEAIALLAGVEVSKSQAAARAGRLGPARAHAVAATRLEPWAGSPYLQLALVEESAGDLAAARRSIEAAIRRDREDWRPWLAAARIETRLGDAAAAARSNARARSLDPRSPLFSRPP